MKFNKEKWQQLAEKEYKCSPEKKNWEALPNLTIKPFIQKVISINLV